MSLTPTEYDRLLGGLDAVAGFLARFRSGRLELIDLYLAPALAGAAAGCLGLGPDWNVADVDQVVAELKADALEQLSPAEWDGG